MRSALVVQGYGLNMATTRDDPCTIATLREALRGVLALTRGPVNAAEMETLVRAVALCEPRAGEAKEGAQRPSPDSPIAFRREYRSTSRPRSRRGP